MEEAPEPTIIPTTDVYHHPFIQTYEPSVARIIEECSNNSVKKKIQAPKKTHSSKGISEYYHQGSGGTMDIRQVSET